MMVPTLPRSHLVVGQPCFALGTLQAFFDAMLRLEHAGEFRHGSGQCRVGEQVIVFPGSVRLPLAEHHQQFRHVRHSAFHARLHQRPSNLHHHRPSLAIADLDGLPRRCRQGSAPAVHTSEGHSPPPTVTFVRRLGYGQVTHQRVRRHGQQIALVARPQFLAKPRTTAQFVVAGNPGVRQCRATFV